MSVEPVFDDGQIRLYHGDCREILPQLEAEVVITDPPYGARLYPTDTDALSPALLASWVAAYRSVAVFGWPERLVGMCVDAGVHPSEWVTWWPTNARYRGFNPRGLWRECECIAAFGDGDWTVLRQPRAVTTTPMPNRGKRIPAGKERADAQMGDVWRDESPRLNPNQRGRLHPNQKPESLMRRLISVTTGTVCDPFAGSGSTLSAARALGRRAVGIEIEESYCAVIIERLAQTSLETGVAA
ncbi:MAG TPA: site-specific DNA-methyltransferase [Solirubrobacteraceae bacterium]